MRKDNLIHTKVIILIICFIISCDTPQVKDKSTVVLEIENPIRDTAKVENLTETKDIIETTELNDDYIICDLDKDNIPDTILYSDVSDFSIVCKLSSQEFKSITSQANLSDEFDSGVRCTKSGFEFYVNYMRAGYANQFRYDTELKKILLIGMSRYEFGPANNDGSGNSSINLLTNRYIGEWNYFNIEIDSLIKMPTIDTKMYIKRVSLEEYDGSSQSQFEEQCYEHYKKHSNKIYH